MPAPWCAKRRNLDRSSKKDGWQQGFGTGRLKFKYQSEHFFGIEKEIMTRVRKHLVQLSFKHLPVVIPGHHTTSSLVLSGGQDRVPYPLWALSHCIIANLQWWQPCTAMPLQCYIYIYIYDFRCCNILLLFEWYTCIYVCPAQLWGYGVLTQK